MLDSCLSNGEEDREGEGRLEGREGREGEGRLECREGEGRDGEGRLVEQQVEQLVMGEQQVGQQVEQLVEQHVEQQVEQQVHLLSMERPLRKMQQRTMVCRRRKFRSGSWLGHIRMSQSHEYISPLIENKCQITIDHKCKNMN